MLLPGNVVVRETANGRLDVGFIDPDAAMQLTSNPKVRRVAHEARQRLKLVRSALGVSTATAATANH